MEKQSNVSEYPLDYDLTRRDVPRYKIIPVFGRELETLLQSTESDGKMPDIEKKIIDERKKCIQPIVDFCQSVGLKKEYDDFKVLVISDFFVSARLTEDHLNALLHQPYVQKIEPLLPGKV